MNDLISRSELIAFLKEKVPNDNYYLYRGYLKAVERIESMPYGNMKAWKRKCSVCNTYRRGKTNYCPHCGAKMTDET